MSKVFTALAFSLIITCSTSAQSLINGELWNDTDGKIINAHGGGILYHNATYFWFGEVKGMGKDGYKAMDGVSCYSSKDLLNWKNEGLVLKMIADTNSMFQPGCIVERPKVIYNAKTKMFVMWFHHELKGQSYKAALTGLATANNPLGPFTYIKSIRPNKNVWPTNFSLEQKKPITYPIPKRSDSAWKNKVVEGMFVVRDFEQGQMARDMTLFVDDDGTAYHVASSEDNQTLHVAKLNDSYTDFTDEYYRILPGESNEAPAIFKYKKKYFLIASGTTGWSPNPGRSFVADNIYGPWKSLGDPVRGTKEEKATTFYSQSTYVLPIAGKKNTFLYLGDRWDPKNLAESKYIWLPITFENNSPVLYWKKSWTN